MMKRFFQTLALGACALAAGCVQLEQDLTLKADGSGFVSVAYAAPEAEQTMMQQAARAMLSQTLAASGTNRLPQDMSDAEIRKQFEGYAKFGVRLEQLTTERKAGRVIRRGLISFKTLAGLARALLPERTVSLTHDARGNYQLAQQAGGGNTLAGRLAAVAADDSNPLVAELFRGFRATVRVTAPGRVLDANAAQAEGATAVWRFDFDRDAQAVAKLLQRPMRLSFAGQGLALAPFVHRAGEP
jgi:hypothetical protein